MTAVVFAVAGGASAQNDFQRTNIVDPNGSPYFSTIQGAVDDFDDNPSVRLTVLIYAGTYIESVTLDETQENIDLVGVDPDAVIIAPTSGKGITITSGQESARHNSIRNLTIQTGTGNGIEIVRGAGQGDNAPKNILIDNVTISAGGTGVLAPEAQDLTIRNSVISSSGADGVKVYKPQGESTPTGFALIGSTVSSAGSAKNALNVKSDDGLRVLGSELTSTGGNACNLSGADALEMRSCTIVGGDKGLFITGFDGVSVLDTVINSVGYGFETSQLSGALRAANCSITAHGNTTSDVYALRLDNSTPAFHFQNCRIEAINDGTGAAIGAYGDAGTVTFEGCDLIARNESTSGSGGPAIGIDHTNSTGAPYTVVGGSIVTSAAAERQTEIYDIHVDRETPKLSLSGTDFSKWRGPILTAFQPRTVSQRVLGAAQGTATATLGATELTGMEQSIESGFNQPDVYRALSIKGNQSVMDQTVILIGTNRAGARIAENIQLNGTTEVAGNKSFMTITKIILPVLTVENQTVSVGRTNKFGLDSPLFEDADVIQWSKLDATTGSYVVQTTSLGVDETWATVDPGTLGASPERFEFSLLAP